MQDLAPARITLRQVWADYQLVRKLKPITVRNYEQRLRVHLQDWLDMPIEDITKDMVEIRHRLIPGEAMANSTFRTLRALLHFASFKYEGLDGTPLIKNNPVRRLSELRAWHRDKKRRRIIKPTQMPQWFRAVFSVPNSTVRDLLLLILLTGMRLNEAGKLTWKQVDLNQGIIHIGNTKNGYDFELPMSDYIWKMLATRKIGALNEFVFPGTRSTSGLHAAWSSFHLVKQRSGVEFSFHDLRRTFATTGDEVDLKNEVVKNLLNHVPQDVTEGVYIVRSTERLRRATQKITDQILVHAGINKSREPASSATP